MTAKVFVDSNILIYSKDTAVPKKQTLALQWMDYLWKNRAGRLSIQVLQEFYVTVTTKLKPGLRKEEAREAVNDFFSWLPLPLSETVLRDAWKIEDRNSISFWDSLILSAAAVQRCSYLLTEDLNDGQEIDGVRVINPFRHTPSDL